MLEKSDHAKGPNSPSCRAAISRAILVKLGKSRDLDEIFRQAILVSIGLDGFILQ
jgi:hypothetical protein